MPGEVRKSQDLRRSRLGSFPPIGLGLGSRIEGLDEANQLPALGFGELGPYRHAAPDHAVSQQPEERSRSGALHLVGAQAGGLFSTLSHVSVALGAMLGEEFASGGHGIRI